MGTYFIRRLSVVLSLKENLEIPNPPISSMTDYHFSIHNYIIEKLSHSTSIGRCVKMKITICFSFHEN